MPTDFSFLRQRLDPTLRTAKYTVSEIVCDPPFVIEGRYAGQANAEYWHALTELGINEAKEERNRPARTPQERARIFAEAQAEVSDEQRSRDRRLYPQHVFVGWSGCPGHHKETGAVVQVPFSVEDAAALLDAVKGLPDVVFDRMRSFFRNADNFMDRTPLSAAGAAATAKNS